MNDNEIMKNEKREMWRKVMKMNNDNEMKRKWWRKW